MTVELLTSGFGFAGWLDVSVTRSIDQLADTFEVSFTERWSQESKAIPIVAGEAVEVLDDGDRLITGYVDESTVSYGADSHEMKVSGRSTLGDLVDCAAVVRSGQFKNQTFANIASALVDPFGIAVVVDTDTGETFRRFAIQDGETVFEVLERMARARGLLCTSTADGELLITRAGSRRVSTPIELGRNIERGSRRDSNRDRFSSYTVLSQNSGSQDWNSRSAAHVLGDATDSTVGRHRPMRIIGESQMDGKAAAKRATWERNVRFGRARGVTYTLRGWRDDDGALWQPNTIAHVVDGFSRIDDDLLITGVRFAQNSEGRTSELTMTRPEAYDVNALPARKRSDGSFW